MSSPNLEAGAVVERAEAWMGDDDRSLTAAYAHIRNLLSLLETRTQALEQAQRSYDTMSAACKFNVEKRGELEIALQERTQERDIAQHNARAHELEAADAMRGVQSLVDTLRQVTQERDEARKLAKAYRMEANIQRQRNSELDDAHKAVKRQLKEHAQALVAQAPDEAMAELKRFVEYYSGARVSHLGTGEAFQHWDRSRRLLVQQGDSEKEQA